MQSSVRFFCFFFFQAEDGIRDLIVTGVQTCALPISAASVKEIYSRIVRRGSFWFDSPRLAHPLVARALNIMTEEGEIRCFKNDTLWRWQRLTPREDPDPDLSS